MKEKTVNKIEIPNEMPKGKLLVVSYILKRVYLAAILKDGTMSDSRKDMTNDFLRCIVERFAQDSPSEITDSDGRVFELTLKQTAGPELPK
jgi:hypothetical protein